MRHFGVFCRALPITCFMAARGSIGLLGKKHETRKHSLHSLRQGSDSRSSKDEKGAMLRLLDEIPARTVKERSSVLYDPDGRRFTQCCLSIGTMSFTRPRDFSSTNSRTPGNTAGVSKCQIQARTFGTHMAFPFQPMLSRREKRVSYRKIRKAGASVDHRSELIRRN
jgi:hypothetical protein